MKTFGEALKEARKASRLTLRRISEIVGLSVSYLSDIEQGRRRAPADDIVGQLETALNITDGSLKRLAERARNVAPRMIAHKIASTPKLSEVLMRADDDLTEAEFKDLMDFYEEIKLKRG
jgi:transcriptional regulator with XRE-family HTH domain